MLFYLAFLSACAFTLQGYLLKYNPVSKVAVFKSTNPLFGALFSALILGESEQLLHYTTLIALALVCGGILIINLLGEGRHGGNKWRREALRFRTKLPRRKKIPPVT